MKLLHLITPLIVVIFFTACKSKQNTEVVEISEAMKIYRATVPQINDLVHTKLELKPDFINQEMPGVATITLKPHFYAVDSLILDAKYMRIESVQIIDTVGGKEVNKDLKYNYDSLKLRIALDKRYTRDQSYTININYVSQPERVPSDGSAAITDRKGLYFINHDNTDLDKPVQLWTQGETEAASCWFPTLDAPNQKSTEEIQVQVPSKYKTISNGVLYKSEMLNASVRIDFWKQEKAHAPYLFALVVGDFAEVKDTWNGKQVNYYVEHSYEKYAHLVFGNTPEMIEFYSNVLMLPYPWDKYHQVVVRDFVSGAMENTGCVVHFDKLQHDNREHLDNPFEDIIAHELFHHWFGDLVTCESWSNLPLNESFATYGEYLWNEYKYGRDEADYKLKEFHEKYIDEANEEPKTLVRYHYEAQEDMFDRHSYQKGGSVLHMLRKYVGDEAFFLSLNKYLKDNAYKTAEVSDLRKAFESVTGEDLNWFFDQWFYSASHPKLKVEHNYSDANGYMR
ncbi:MAG: M1 family metallopeptidase [Bacteroidia bacterium]